MGTNLAIIRGDTVNLEATVTLSGNPYDLTGKILRFTVKKFYKDTDANAVMALVSPTDIEITDAVGGKAKIKITPAKTTALPAIINSLVWDLQVKDEVSNIYTVISGKLTVNPDVTITT